MSINDRNVTWNMHVVGAAEAANEMNNVGTSLEGLDDASRLTATRFTGLASASSAMGTVLSQTSPKVAGLASILGTTGGAVSGLITLLGGVGGLAAGGLIVALSLAVKAFNDSTDAVNEYDTALKNNKNTLAAYITKVKELDEQERLLNNTRMGSLEIIEQRALLLKKEAELEELLVLEKQLRAESTESALATVFEAIGMEETAETVRVMKDLGLEFLGLRKTQDALHKGTKGLINTRSQEIQVIKQNIKDQIFMDELNRGNIAAAGVASDKRAAAAKAAMARLKAEEARLKKIYDAMRIDDLQLMSEEEAFKEHLDRMTLHEEAYFDERTRRMNEFLAEQKRQEDAAAAAFEGAWQGSLTTVQSGFNDLAANMLAGNDISLENILNMMGTQIIKDGIKNMWVAGGMLLNPITAGQGGALMAYSAAEIAAGTAMAQVSGGAGGAGGAGGGGGNLRQARPTPVEPQGDRFAEQPVELHFHHLKPSKDVGKEVATSLQMYGQKFGRSAMPKIPGIN